MKWEYLTELVLEIELENGPMLTRTMNALGKLGWELVTSITVGKHTRLIYKRPLKETNEEPSSTSGTTKQS